MSSILVVSPDTIPLKSNKVDLKTNAYTAIGKRCYLLAKYLDADLALPTLNCNKTPLEIKKQKLLDIEGDVVLYDYDKAVNKYSEFLGDIFKQYDTVIIQSTYGIGWANCLKYKGTVIIDGLAPWEAEYEYFSLIRGYDENLHNSYKQLMNRADYTLYANDNQYDYYKNMFYKDSRVPLIKVPYGMVNKKSFLIFAPFYPWLDISIYEILINMMLYETFSFVANVHPRFKGLSKDTLNTLKKYAEYPNVDISLCDAYIPINELPHDYHLALCFGFENSLETKLASRTRVINLLEHDFNVVTNWNDSLRLELSKNYRLFNFDTSDPIDLARNLQILLSGFKENTYSTIYEGLRKQLERYGVLEC